MHDNIAVGGYWLIGMMMANSVFLIRRIPFMLSVWGVCAIFFVLLGIAMESSTSLIREKSLSFYVVMVLIFTLLGLPGYVVRFLKKG